MPEGVETPRKELWEILVPTMSNAGKPFRTRFHRVWDAKVEKISGGLTIHMPTKGKWVHEGCANKIYGRMWSKSARTDPLLRRLGVHV